MAKNWTQGGVLLMGAIQHISAAGSLLAQGRQLRGREMTAALPSKTLLPDTLSLCCFTKPRIKKSSLALNGSPGDRQGQTNTKTSRIAAAYINSGTWNWMK